MVTEPSERIEGLSASRHARALRRAAAHFCDPPRLPRLWFFTDPTRTPDPCRIASALPAGAAVVYRHFGEPDRRRTARRLSRLCQRHGLRLLIGADHALAEAVGAHGVHLPERLATRARLLRGRRPDWLITAAAHGSGAMHEARGIDAFVLSTVYSSKSLSAGAPLTLPRAARIARASELPVIALGGVTLARMRELAHAGFSGAAGIEMFLE